MRVNGDIDGRTRIGIELLNRFSQSGRLFFYTKRGLAENRRFRVELLERVLSQIGEITCLDGARISLAGFIDNPRIRSVYAAATNLRPKLAPFSPDSKTISPL